MDLVWRNVGIGKKVTPTVPASSFNSKKRAWFTLTACALLLEAAPSMTGQCGGC